MDLWILLERATVPNNEGSKRVKEKDQKLARARYRTLVKGWAGGQCQWSHANFHTSSSTLLKNTCARAQCCWHDLLQCQLPPSPIKNSSQYGLHTGHEAATPNQRLQHDHHQRRRRWRRLNNQRGKWANNWATAGQAEVRNNYLFFIIFSFDDSSSFLC